MKKLNASTKQVVKDQVPDWLKKYGLARTKEVLRKLAGEDFVKEVFPMEEAVLKHSNRLFAMQKSVARKDYPEFGITKGTYHWYWVYGGKIYRSAIVPPTAECYDSSDTLMRILPVGAGPEWIWTSSGSPPKDGA